MLNKTKQTKPKQNKTKQNKTKIKENNKMALTLTGSILSKISFCDKQCSNVNDNKTKGQIIQDIDKKYGIQIVTRDYNIINPNIVRNVLYHQHILTPYTHGNPYMLYLTKIDNINCALFIDKKLKDGYTYPKIHCVKYRFSDELYEKDTIFTGELVRDNERRWFFLIDNLLLYKGMKTNEKNILSKFELINKIMENDYTPDKYLEICPLYIKKLFLYKDIKKMVNDFIPNLSYMCKGIVFYTLNNKHSNYLYMIPRENQIQVKSSNEIDEIIEDKYPDLYNKKNSMANETMFIPDSLNDNSNSNVDDNNNDYSSKNNNTTTTTTTNVMNNSQEEKEEMKTIEIEANNAVFKVLKTDIPDIYNLYCNDMNDNLIKHAIALIPNIKTSHLLYYTFNSKSNNLGLTMECKFSKVFEKWIPLKFVEHSIYNKEKIETLEENLKEIEN